MTTTRLEVLEHQLDYAEQCVADQMNLRDQVCLRFGASGDLTIRDHPGRHFPRCGCAWFNRPGAGPNLVQHEPDDLVEVEAGPERQDEAQVDAGVGSSGGSMNRVAGNEVIGYYVLVRRDGEASWAVDWSGEMHPSWDDAENDAKLAMEAGYQAVICALLVQSSIGAAASVFE